MPHEFNHTDFGGINAKDAFLFLINLNLKQGNKECIHVPKRDLQVEALFHDDLVMAMQL